MASRGTGRPQPPGVQPFPVSDTVAAVVVVVVVCRCRLHVVVFVVVVVVAIFFAAYCFAIAAYCFALALACNLINMTLNALASLQTSNLSCLLACSSVSRSFVTAHMHLHLLLLLLFPLVTAYMRLILLPVTDVTAYMRFSCFLSPTCATN